MTDWPPERHAAARKACEAATRGPWVRGFISSACHKVHGPDELGPYHDNGFCAYTEEFLQQTDPHSIASPSSVTDIAGNYEWDQGGIIHERDSDFIVTARTDLPAALDEIDRLNDGLRAAVDPVRSWFDGDGEIEPAPSDLDIARMAVEELVRDRDEFHAAVADAYKRGQVAMRRDVQDIICHRTLEDCLDPFGLFNAVRSIPTREEGAT